MTLKRMKKITKPVVENALIEEYISLKYTLKEAEKAFQAKIKEDKKRLDDLEALLRTSPKFETTRYIVETKTTTFLKMVSKENAFKHYTEAELINMSLLEESSRSSLSVIDKSVLEG